MSVFRGKQEHDLAGDGRDGGTLSLDNYCCRGNISQRVLKKSIDIERWRGKCTFLFCQITKTSKAADIKMYNNSTAIFKLQPEQSSTMEACTFFFVSNPGWPLIISLCSPASQSESRAERTLLKTVHPVYQPKRCRLLGQQQQPRWNSFKDKLLLFSGNGDFWVLQSFLEVSSFASSLISCFFLPFRGR